jgi:hypothetical protein
VEPCGDGIATRACETVCGLGARQAQSSTSTTLGHFERSDRDADKATKIECLLIADIVLMVVLNYRRRLGEKKDWRLGSKKEQKSASSSLGTHPERG